jgi:hypothetical protein
MENLKLSEVFEKTDDGFFSIIGGDTRLSDLGERIDVIFGGGEDAATIGDFIDAGIINDVGAADSAKLEHYLGTADWREMGMTEFVNGVISVISRLP